MLLAFMKKNAIYECKFLIFLITYKTGMFERKKNKEAKKKSYTVHF